VSYSSPCCNGATGPVAPVPVGPPPVAAAPSYYPPPTIH
jgi:hypothetical protein